MILGIDIAKVYFDVLLQKSESEQYHRRLRNSAAGIRALIAWLVHHQVTDLHVCMEATNVYWEAVAEALHAEGYRVSVVNPARIRGFALSELRRNKTDKQDSQVIAAYCAAMQPPAWEPPTASERTLRALSRHRDGLIKTLTQQKNRLASSTDETVSASLQKLIEVLQAEIDAIDEQMAQHVALDEKLRSEKALLVSITSVGEVTAHKLLAEMYDLARYAAAPAAAADAGLTPAHHESGSSVRKRPKLSKVGKASVRGALYMPALNAMQNNPILRSFAQRLAQKDKPKKVIIAAVMRKLLHIAYGVLKNRTPFDPHYATASAAA